LDEFRSDSVSPYCEEKRTMRGRKNKDNMKGEKGGEREKKTGSERGGRERERGEDKSNAALGR
jgi:hypothetical protein